MKSTHHAHLTELRQTAWAVALLCASNLAAAQTPPASATSTWVAALQTVVVSATRGERLRDDLPLSMDVLSAAELEDAQTADIRDLARTLPNVSVRRAPARYTVTGAGNATGRDGNAGFNVRGQDGNRVLMLVDGVRLPRSYINGNNAFGRDAVNLELLRRVELVRGPTSVLYGSDGLAGMVNFITLEPADLLRGPGSALRVSGGKLAYQYSGDDEGHTVAASAAGQGGPAWQWLLSGMARRTHAMGNMGENVSANADRTTPNPQADQRSSVLAKLVFAPGAESRQVLTLEHSERASDVQLLSSRAKPPLLAASVVDETAGQSQRRDRLTWDARWRVDSALADQWQVALTRQTSSAQDDGHTTRSDGGIRLRNTSYDEAALSASVQALKRTEVGSTWTQQLTYGLDLTQTDITSWFGGSDPKPLPIYVPKKYFPDTRDSMAGVFVQSEWSSGPWSITPALRWEQFGLRVLTQEGFAPPAPTPARTLTGSNVSPKLGLLYKLGGSWSVFAHYSAGFRAPNATQINGFVENPTPTTFVRLLSNPDLKPETSANVELGVRGRADRWQWDAAVFSGNFHDLIVDKKPLGGAGTSASPLLFQTVNVNRARIEGFEVKGSVDWGDWAGLAWTSTGAYGQTQGKDLVAGVPLNSIDPAKLALGMKASAAQWEFAVELLHHDAKRESDLDSPYLPKPATPPRVRQFTVPASTTLDVRAQWRAALDLRVLLSVSNLTNRTYWMWSDVQGLAATSTALDAYTQPGRHVNVSVIKNF
jgi:hemoglobin/transferrin/lactoferrin receptor protein